MDRYVGTKLIMAEPMDQFLAAQAGLCRDATVAIGHDGRSADGYKVVYPDGYISWSPKETFEGAYRKVTEAELKLLGLLVEQPAEPAQEEQSERA